MFKVIKVDGQLQLAENKMDLRNVAIEYFEEYNMTLLYCFNMKMNKIYDLLEVIKNECVLSPQTFHHAYKKHYFYDEMDPNIISTIKNQEKNKVMKEIVMLNKLYTKKYFIFFEIKQRYQRIKEIIEFDNLDELKQALEVYQVKYLVPFFYSNREMKEFIKENKMKIKDLSLIYVLENKSLEGKKR